MIPKTAKKKGNKVLVEGEVTGHAHRLADGQVYEDADRVLFTVPYPTEIQHEEHDYIPVPEKGTYDIVRQRQYENEDKTKLVVD